MNEVYIPSTFVPIKEINMGTVEDDADMRDYESE
jgi:hypothetical protein